MAASTLLDSLQIRPQVRALHDEVIALRRDFHKHPELGLEEVRTAAKIAEYLEGLGLPVETGIGRTGVVALLEGEAEGPTVMLRADIDALPLPELNEVPYASIHEGKMHACGHDGHTAILLGTAKLLTAARANLKGRVKFVFQPAEEHPGGARLMIEDGVLENPKVDAAFGLHIWSTVPVGCLGVRSGPILAAPDEIHLVVKGKGCHAAHPDQGVDPVVMAGQVLGALQTIASRRIDPVYPVVVSVCSVHGGSAYNIIPDQVEMRGTVRTFQAEVRERVPELIEEILKGVTSAHGGDYEFNHTFSYPPTVNDEAMTALVREAVTPVVGAEAVLEQKLNMGGEDMSYFLEQVPGCFYGLGGGNEAKGINAPHHNSRFNIDEDCLAIGVECHLRILERYLGVSL